MSSFGTDHAFVNMYSTGTAEVDFIIQRPLGLRYHVIFGPWHNTELVYADYCFLIFSLSFMHSLLMYNIHIK